MKRRTVILFILVIGLTAIWYVNSWHQPVERLDTLIGQNYDYAHEKYFRSEPDEHYEVNIKKNLTEFDSGILKAKEILTDSIVQVFTWEFTTHKETIWVGDTKKMKRRIIDAIRYKNNVQF